MASDYHPLVWLGWRLPDAANDRVLAAALRWQDWTRNWAWLEPRRMYLLAAYRKTS